MALQSEYHGLVRHTVSASILFASLILMVLFFVSSGLAQINAPPSSVTSPGFGGRPTNGTPPSVTSLGPHGFTPGRSPAFVPAPFPSPNQHLHNGNQHRGHHLQGQNFVPWIYAVPVPYGVDDDATDDGQSGDDPDYQGGPTIFDRRGSGAESYIPPVRDVAPPAQSQNDAQNPPGDQSAASPEESTVLVFKDGHQLEVANYAIVGSTLFDLTPGHSRRIALADLNLDATLRQNDDRGVIFRLPPGTLENE